MGRCRFRAQRDPHQTLDRQTEDWSTKDRSLAKADPAECGKSEIELTVSPGQLNGALENLKSQGLDPSRTDVTFSLDTVMFSDELHWNKGNLIRPDPTIPGKWVPVDDPVAMK